MLLTADIGNTNINFGIFKANKIIRRFSIPTHDYNGNKLRKLLRGVFVKDVVICSVVPSMNNVLEKDAIGLIHKKPSIIGKDIKVPIKNLYKNPRQVGQDRLVSAYSGLRLYRAPLVVVDFGTAITFDIVSKNKAYLGGMILPGLRISLGVLADKTALLPKIKLQEPREFIGRNTKNSMLSGIIYGFAALCDDLVDRIRNKIGKKAKVVGTGGNIGLIGKYCSNLDIIDKDLILKGMKIIYSEKL